MTILKEILAEKQKEVAALKQQPIKSEKVNERRCARITDTFTSTGHLNIIAEIKRASPSKGALNLKLDPVAQAKKYETLGAGAISVLTDQVFFKGSIKDLRAIREAVNLPILCKDFIIDPIQIDYAKANGANIILLIAAALSEEQFASLYQYATNQGLEVLCEVHQMEELDVVLKQQAPIIGINNRNLHDFHVDLTVTEKILPHIKGKASITISESGIRTAEDAQSVASYGANTILVGESFVRAKNLADTFAQLQVPLAVGSSSHAR